MKRFALLIGGLAATLSLSAQGIHIIEDFETNHLGWTETTSDEGEAVIRDGVLHLSGKKRDHFDFYGYKSKGSQMISSCYPGIDVSKNFEVRAKIVAKTVNEKDSFGVIFNYLDDYNYNVLVIDRKTAVLLRIEKNEIIGYRVTDLKATSRRNAEYNLKIKSTYQDLEFYNNDVQVLRVRHLPMQYSGFGIYINGLQTIDVEEVEFIQ